MSEHKINIQEVIDFINAQTPETAVYIGVDSEKFRKNGKWYADYTLAIVVHIDSAHGCKVFGEVQREQVFDAKKDRPAMRLMTEVYKAADLYLQLADALADRYVEIHLDLNPDERHGSSCVIQQAIGYVKGTCGVIPKVKPRSWAASYAADRLKDILVIGAH
jgi:predicted RNase H-related nuclease YkuK (DUF458 family)